MAIHVAELMDRRHSKIYRAQLRLQLRPQALRGDGFTGIGIVAVLYELQGDLARVPGVGGEIHVRHPAPSELLVDLVVADALEISLHDLQTTRDQGAKGSRAKNLPNKRAP